jgi:hypothetical protein
MQTRSFLKKVEVRATLRDQVRGMLRIATLVGFIIFLYAIADSLLILPIKTRSVTSACILVATLVAVTLDLGRKSRKRGLVWAANHVERWHGALKNQLVTIAEHELSELKMPAYVRARIEGDLALRLGPITAARVIRLKPGRPISLLFISAVALYALALLLSPQAFKNEFKRLALIAGEENSSVTGESVNDPASRRLDGPNELWLTLTPPAYTRLGPSKQAGDGNIVALVGTRVELHLIAHQELSSALISPGRAPAMVMAKEGEHSYKASFAVEQDSIYALTLAALDDPERKWEEVYTVRAIKDQPPEIHITSPTSDLLFESGDNARTIPIAITAKDDYDVASMKLKYIKTSGEGDAAKFESGEIAIDRLPGDVEGRARGSAQLDLGAIGVASGGSVVFHAEAFDRNNISGPGAGFSENIIIQIRGAEPIKISLDDLRPDEALKYLTSQRMILIKTEKLHRARGRTPAEDFLSRSREIAAEQKRFRESFNQFTEVESEHEHTEENEAQPSPNIATQPGSEDRTRLKSGEVPDIPAGGDESLREMLVAIKAMWRAEGALGAADTGLAIEHEKEALVHLKAAQKGLRYSPRVVASIRRVDLKRRYLGELDGIRSRLERVPRKQESEFDSRLRASLSLVYDVARTLSGIRSSHPEADQQIKQAQKIKQARQNIARAADELLSIKGELASSLLEPAAKLKLLGRVLGSYESSQAARADSASDEQQKAFGLTVQVASEMSALLGRAEQSSFASSPNNLSPTSRARAATYFKLLANP